MKNNFFICFSFLFFAFASVLSATEKKDERNDRAYWCSLLYRISEPILSNMSKEELKKT